MVERCAVAIPFEAVEEVKSRFSNTLYGFFIGKRLAFPLVENYVKNTWAKYGLRRTQLHDDFFLFQFETKEGMDRVLEDGPWLIRTVPLILNPITLDSYTSTMCLSSWGKSTYARALIEVSAEKELVESLVIAIPVDKENGHTLATINIEYEWNPPPRCSTCMIFDHHSDKALTLGLDFQRNLVLHGTSNYIGWNKYDVDVSVISQSDQVIHVRLWLRLEKKELFCSFIYGHNRYSTRRYNKFNTRIDYAMLEFKECIDEIEVKDISCTGLHYTWTQKPRGFDGLFKKIDRVMGNNEFINMFMGAHAIFKPYRISDHAPAMLVIPTVTKPSPKPFKSAFLDVFSCYVLNWTRFKTDLDLDPFNLDLREEEVAYVQAYNQAIVLEERFLQQKAKVLWLKEGDSNSAFFHKAVKGRVSRNRIDVVTDVEAQCIMDALDEFKEVIPFEEGRLPVKYLGVPLVPSRTYLRDSRS
ncbi:RNA-directed DNA polymerase, eukaryota, reverse transcriptase zinc-binding domain protein [Tanacetum coccineum]